MAVITVQITTRTSDQVNAPLLYRVGKDYNVVTNIRRAQVTEDFGFVEVDIEGSLEEVQRAVSFLHQTGYQVSAQQRSVGTDTDNL